MACTALVYRTVTLPGLALATGVPVHVVSKRLGHADIKITLSTYALGAVYEGLMAYTGFFAREDLYEV